MRLAAIHENARKIHHAFSNMLGNGRPLTLNYGSTDDRDPLLYVAMSPGVITQCAMVLESDFSVAVSADRGIVVPRGKAPRGMQEIEHVDLIRNDPGHMSIAYPPELEAAFGRKLSEYQGRTPDQVTATYTGLRRAKLNGKPLFTDDGGMAFKVDVYRDQFIANKTTLPGTGKPAWNVAVEARMGEFIPLREALGLKGYPTNGDGDSIGPHISLGYFTV